VASSSISNKLNILLFTEQQCLNVTPKIMSLSESGSRTNEPTAAICRQPKLRHI